MFDFLRDRCPTLWRDSARAHAIQLTVDVFDRFHYRRVVAEHDGQVDELAPANPVCVPPISTGSIPTEHVLVQLYCHTHRDGTGWHYEWISSIHEDTTRRQAASAAASDQRQQQQQQFQPHEIAVPSDDEMREEEPEQEPTDAGTRSARENGNSTE